MRIRKIDFDPPPPPQQHSRYYDVRLNNTASTDGAFINTNHKNYNGKYLDSSSIEEENECDEETADNASLAWSNAPAIEDSPKSQHTEYEEEDEFQYTDTKLQNRTHTDLTDFDDDDDDEDNSVFLNWPELPELSLESSSQPQHEQLQQRVYGVIGNASSSDRPNWFNWGRRATVPGAAVRNNDKDDNKDDEDTTTEIRAVAETKNNNDDTSNGKASDNKFLVPVNQQWWQFGRRRTFESYSNSGGRKSSAVESNVANSGTWRVMESFINGADSAGRKSSSSDELNGDGIGVERMNSDGAEETSELQTSIKRPIQRRVSIDDSYDSFLTNRQRSFESNNSSFTDRRKSVESKSSSSSVEEEVNDWLFPRRGRRATVTSSEPSDPPQSHGDDVDVIINKFRESSVNLSPMDRVLLKDIASSKDSNRWQKRPSLLSQQGSSSRSLWDDDDDVLWKVNGEEAKRPPQSLTNSSSRELNESQQGLPEVYWDSEKMSKMKGEGVSLARAKAIDEISSLASSDHSGHILRKSRSSRRRLSFKASIFGWNNTISDEDADDDVSFRPAQITPRTNPGKLSSMNTSKVTSGKLSSIKTSIRPRSMVISSQSKILLSKSKRRSSIEVSVYDDDDEDEDDEIDSMKNVRAGRDSKYETISKEANEIMDSVNNSVLAMGMSAPFRPMDEICPPFQKLHKNLGYQMDALNAAIVRSTKSTSSKKKGMKKSKRMSQSTLTTSFNSGSSSTDNSNQSSTLSLFHDSQALSKYILAQMAILQSKQTDGSTVNTNNMTPHSFYTSWLPNYMWYQPIAADASSVMRPTSLCTGTGITGDEQYLNPEMLKVFEMFSTYFVGSKHLFQDDDGDDEEVDENANMRRSYWMDTIEEIDSDDISSDSSSSSESASDESDMVYELSEVGTGIDQFVDTEKQIEILQTVINDLKKSRLMNDRTFVSIKAEPGPESNLSSSTSSNEINTSARGSNLYSSLSSNEINTSNRESNLSASTLTNENDII